MLFVRGIAVLIIAAVLAGCVSPENPPRAATPTTHSAKADAIARIVTETMTAQHLKSAIVRVTVDGKEMLTAAFGESMAGVPATTDMHFRNGAVAISYVATLLLRLVDEHKVSLDDRLSKYLPDTPHADQVTLRQLAQMTSGYPDYVIGNEPFAAQLYADPFHQFEPQDLLVFALDRPLLYPPGTNWNYAHTNYVLLGLALEKATGRQMPDLLDEYVLRPLGLTDTANSFTPQIPQPVLHAFTSERRAALKIPAGTPFYEESTYWNPSWTITHGAIQTSTITDLATTASGIGSGKLLSPASYAEMTSTKLRGTGHTQPGCTTCAPQDGVYTYGLGLVISGEWLLQNPLFFGYAAVEAYLPAQRIAIAAAVTYDAAAFDDEGNYANAGDTLFRKIGAALAPEHAPPLPPVHNK